MSLTWVRRVRGSGLGSVYATSRILYHHLMSRCRALRATRALADALNGAEVQVYETSRRSSNVGVSSPFVRDRQRSPPSSLP
jgi:hypothetical protein